MKNEQFTQLTTCARKSEVKKRYLGKMQIITPLQRAWVRCLLDVWGEKYGGSEGPDTQKCSVIGRLMVRKEWNDRESERIIQTVENLHKQGYSGNELFLKAKQILSPGNSVSNLLDRANDKEDADLVESIMCKLFAPNNPIRAVAIKYYCERKSSQDIARELSKLTGVEFEYCRWRIRWCRELLEAAVYHAVKRGIGAKSHDIAA